MNNCPECGAAVVDGLDCWGQLGGVLAWEVDDRELAAVHFLTVASYNLQHPAQFTTEAINGLQTLFCQHLDEGIPIQKIRQQVSAAAEGQTKVLKPEAERRPVLRPWPMTINAVYIPDHPENAAERVRQWAAAIRAELD